LANRPTGINITHSPSGIPQGESQGEISECQIFRIEGRESGSNNDTSDSMSARWIGQIEYGISADRRRAGEEMESGVLSDVLLPLAIVLIMITMGMTLTGEDFQRLRLQKRAVAVGLFCQLVLLSS